MLSDTTSLTPTVIQNCVTQILAIFSQNALNLHQSHAVCDLTKEYVTNLQKYMQVSDALTAEAKQL